MKEKPDPLRSQVILRRTKRRRASEMHLPNFPPRPRGGVKEELRDTGTSNDSLFWRPSPLWVSGKIPFWQWSTIRMQLSAVQRGLEFQSWFHYGIDKKVRHLRVWLGNLPEWCCHSETTFCGKNCMMTACLWPNGNCNWALEESMLQKAELRKSWRHHWKTPRCSLATDVSRGQQGPSTQTHIQEEPEDTGPKDSQSLLSPLWSIKP